MEKEKEKENMTPEPKCKPYPWWCPECRKREIYPVTEPYETVCRHNNKDYNIRIDALDYAKCRNCGAVALEVESCQAITSELRKVADIPTPEEIKQLRISLGLSLFEFAGLCETNEKVIEMWESGTMYPDGAKYRGLCMMFLANEARCSSEVH